jgi:hypothetical protein
MNAKELKWFEANKKLLLRQKAHDPIFKISRSKSFLQLILNYFSSAQKERKQLITAMLL